MVEVVEEFVEWVLEAVEEAVEEREMVTVKGLHMVVLPVYHIGMVVLLGFRRLAVEEAEEAD